MIRRPTRLRAAWLVLTLSLPIYIGAEPLEMNVSGQSQEKAPLETYPADPSLPPIDKLGLSLDGGVSAAELELDPLPVSKAARLRDPFKISLPFFSQIPTPPFLVLPIDPKILELSWDGWRFQVVDETNHVWHKEEGAGIPPNPLAWNDVIDPNHTYIPLLVLMSSGTPTSVPGEAVRLLALAHEKDNSVVIDFGARVYREDQARFSDDANLYLEDLSGRIERMRRSSSIEITVLEPETGDLAQSRLSLWRTYLEKQMERKLTATEIRLQKGAGPKASVRVVMKGEKLPAVDAVLKGEAKQLSVPMENIDSLIQIRTVKNVMFIEFRHDRLFLPGTAYLRDEVLPVVRKALQQVREADANQKIVLRSFTEKTKEQMTNRQEDPKLAAIRSKVLFSLFAKERYLRAD